MLAGAVGNLIPALGNAAVGALTASFVNGVVVFAVVCLVALVVGLINGECPPGDRLPHELSRTLAHPFLRADFTAPSTINNNLTMTTTRDYGKKIQRPDSRGP